MGITGFVMGTNWVTVQGSHSYGGPDVSVASTVAVVRIRSRPWMVLGRAAASQYRALVRIRKMAPLGCILAPVHQLQTLLGP